MSLHNGWRLCLLGFLTHFLELVLIRYLAGNIWNLGYFPNLVLLAVFFGMGIGFVLHDQLSSRVSAWVHSAASLILLLLVGWNLLGATLGGIVEYSSMAVGYNALAVIVAICYTLGFALLWTAQGRIQPEASSPLATI